MMYRGYEWQGRHWQQVFEARTLLEIVEAALM
jgi:hypothetical protein